MQNTLTKEQKNKSGIYSITNLVNGKRYIGATKSFYTRFKNYKSESKLHKLENPHLENAIHKYNSNSFVFEAINICREEDLNDMEIYFIKAFDTTNRNKGYNINYGGMTTHNVTVETKRKISNSLIGHNVYKNTILKISNGVKKSWKDGCYKSLFKPINQYNLNDNFIQRFDSSSIAAIKVTKNKNSDSLINRCLRGKCKTAYGFKWKYA